MPFLDPYAANRKPERELSIQFGVREIGLAGRVDLVHYPLVESVEIALAARARSKADQCKRHRRQQFEVIRGFDPFAKKPGQAAVFTQAGDDSLRGQNSV